ncbi:MAG: mechanosensitive ion channel family protein [Candidatus Omnitrophica bacterium]|nr:mechanosensitive ion channel family protein [Candidatus Omnitrophota bacterium]MDD5351920.1 mechanosensitive ion channel family protein [Candidatus Omnitrophota bacterium]MDD5550746.1 mechanosensitive ion channel family protein [Candidatus Omnitrophota bacterium]
MIKDIFLDSDLQTRIILSIGIMLFFYLAKRTASYSINKYIENINLKHTFKRLAVYISGALVLLILGFIWLRKIHLGIILSLSTAGLIISLGDLILSFVAWFFITLRKPFEIGERVQIGSIKGDVVDIRGFDVTLLEIGGWIDEEQSTGRVVHIPNNFIFRQPVYNYTKGFNFIWNEIKITITFESNYKNAKDICLKYLSEFHNSWAEDLDKKIKHAQNIYAIYYKELNPIVYVKIVDSGVVLSLRYLVEPHNRRFSENFLYGKILDEFSKADDIKFAYTTYRITDK